MAAIVNAVLGLVCLGVSVSLAIGYPRALDAARTASTDGELRYGAFQKFFGWWLVVFVGGLVYAALFTDVKRDDWPWLGILLVSFGAMAVYILGDAYGLKGRFDEAGIELRTPWSGLRRESWDDLVEVKFNETMLWYVLRFRSGTKFRIPMLVHGHDEMIALLEVLDEESTNGCGGDDEAP